MTLGCETPKRLRATSRLCGWMLHVGGRGRLVSLGWHGGAGEGELRAQPHLVMNAHGICGMTGRRPISAAKATRLWMRACIRRNIWPRSCAEACAPGAISPTAAYTASRGSVSTRVVGSNGLPRGVSPSASSRASQNPCACRHRARALSPRAARGVRKRGQGWRAHPQPEEPPRLRPAHVRKAVPHVGEVDV